MQDYIWGSELVTWSEPCNYPRSSTNYVALYLCMYESISLININISGKSQRANWLCCFFFFFFTGHLVYEI